MKLFHSLFGPNRCKKHLVWRQNALLCVECGRIAGFRYQIGDGEDNLRVFLFPEFMDQYEAVTARSDTHRIVQTNDVLGHVSFVDFATAIMDMREKIAEITYHGFDGLGAFAPSEEEELCDGQDENSEQSIADRDDCGDAALSDVWCDGGDGAADICG